jgi:hypothetical protein
MKIPLRALAAVVILCVSSAFPAAAEQAPRRLAVAVEAKSEEAYSAAELLQLSRSLMNAVLASSTKILLLDWGPDPFPSESIGAAEAAVERTADAWLLVTVAGGRKSPSLVIRSYDLLLKRNVIEGKLQMEDAFELPDPPASTWAKLVGMVAGAYPPLDTDKPLKPAIANRPAVWTQSTSTLTLHAVPGTVITGLDGGPRTIDETGILTEVVRSPATYLLKAIHPDQLPLESDIYLEDDREITLDQHPPARWAVDAGVYGLSFPQAEGSYFIVPGWLYVRAGLMSYLGGLAFGSDVMFWSAPLTTLYARLGSYAFFPQESLFRPYVGGGFFLRVAHPFGSHPVYIDQASPWGFQITLGFEVSPWSRSKFFIEWLPTEYLTRYPDLFTGSMPDDVRDNFMVLPYAVIDMGGFRIGWRWML